MDHLVLAAGRSKVVQIEAPLHVGQLAAHGAALERQSRLRVPAFARIVTKLVGLLVVEEIVAQCLDGHDFRSDRELHGLVMQQICLASPDVQVEFPGQVRCQHRRQSDDEQGRNRGDATLASVMRQAFLHHKRSTTRSISPQDARSNRIRTARG